MRALFIGAYPNEVHPYNSVFYQQLVHAIADLGVECHVIAAVAYTEYGGKIKRIPTVTHEYTKNGKRITVYHPRYISYSAKKILSFNTMNLTLRSRNKAILKTVDEINLVFDFVYGHFILGGGISAGIIGRRYHIPAFFAYGECDFKSEVSSKHRLTKDEMAGIKGIIAVSSKNLKELESKREFDGIPKLLSLNSMDKELFVKKDKHECREKFGFSDDQFIVGFVGFFKERKGYLKIVEACKDLDDVSLAFAGRGDNKPEGDNIIFCESLDHKDIPAFLNAIDVFALPTQNEGLSNAVVEAMSCGCAIVSSDRPFNWDVLNENNSILIDPDSVTELRDAIITLRDDIGFRNRIAEQAFEDSKEYSIEKRAENILSFIQEICEGCKV